MDTTAIKRALVALGYPLVADGKADPKMKAAVEAFQTAHGLHVDGIVGPKTEAALRAAMSAPGQPAQAPSAIGLAALTSREERRLTAYLDTKGVWTIGIGHTAAAGAPIPAKGMTITRDQCDAIFARDLVQYEDAVRRAIKVDLADHQFDALVSICFNIGVGAFAGSTFVKRINERATPAQIRAAILMWKKPPEIVSRRTAEADQFATPYSVKLPKARSTDAAPIKLAA